MYLDRAFKYIASRLAIVRAHILTIPHSCRLIPTVVIIGIDRSTLRLFAGGEIGWSLLIGRQRSCFFLSFSFPASAFFINFYERILATHISFQLATTLIKRDKERGEVYIDVFNWRDFIFTRFSWNLYITFSMMEK